VKDDRPAVIGFFDLAANKQDFDTFEQVGLLEFLCALHIVHYVELTVFITAARRNGQ